MTTLIAYYSWSGTTKHLAEQLHQLLPGSVLHQIITTPNTYSSDMMQTAYTDQHQKQTEIWPAINAIPNLAPYDQLLIGGPVWTWDLSSPVISFLTKIQNYQGIVRPFYTSVGNSQRYAGWFKKRAGRLKLAPGFDAAHDDLAKWVREIE